ncbi:MAG: pentapeptide repeat-containing protein [Saprospiraceae bacterium]|nr:pentapeptide repeat-containing protein [Saprospiraceae bacterium]
METIFDKTFTTEDYTSIMLTKANYENCEFIDCNFNQCDFSEMSFSDCTFKTCNLSMTIMNKTAMKNVDINECRITGVHFEDCNPFLFSIHCEGCPMEFSTFVQMDLKRSTFIDCQMINVDFTEADLSGLELDGCDLYDAIFEGTNLKDCNLSNARNYTIHPDKNKLRGSRHSIHQIKGLLEHYDLIIE